MPSPESGSADTKRRILDAALETLKREGISGTSARAIARNGGFNQALIFYHFGSINDLLLAAAADASADRVARYRARLEGVTSLHDLVQMAADLHAQDVAEGNITVLTQMLAGAASDPVIALGLRESFEPWIGVVEEALHRVVDGTPFADMLSIDDLAFVITSMFLGIELITHLDADERRDRTLFQTLGALGGMVEGVMALGTAFPGASSDPDA